MSIFENQTPNERRLLGIRILGQPTAILNTLIFDEPNNQFIWAAGSGGGSIFKKVVTNTEQTVNNSTVLVDDLEMNFEAKANTAYRVLVFMHFRSDSNADWKYAMNVPTGTTGGRVLHWSTTVASLPIGFATAQTIATGGGGAMLPFEYVLRVGSNAGIVSLQFAQFVARISDTTRRIGSLMLVFEEDE